MIRSILLFVLQETPLYQVILKYTPSTSENNTTHHSVALIDLHI
jgi:hypothetical protein